MIFLIEKSRYYSDFSVLKFEGISEAVNSNDWNDICERHIEKAIYHKAA